MYSVCHKGKTYNIRGRQNNNEVAGTKFPASNHDLCSLKLTAFILLHFFQIRENFTKLDFLFYDREPINIYTLKVVYVWIWLDVSKRRVTISHKLKRRRGGSTSYTRQSIYFILTNPL